MRDYNYSGYWTLVGPMLIAREYCNYSLMGVGIAQH